MAASSRSIFAAMLWKMPPTCLLRSVAVSGTDCSDRIISENETVSSASSGGGGVSSVIWSSRLAPTAMAVATGDGSEMEPEEFAIVERLHPLDVKVAAVALRRIVPPSVVAALDVELAELRVDERSSRRIGARHHERPE